VTADPTVTGAAVIKIGPDNEAINTMIADVDADRAFGMHMVLNLFGCDPATVADGPGIAAFAGDLVDRIGMQAYGPPQVPHFGWASEKTAGHTLVQLIETSLISAHFSPARAAMYLDVFSCRPFIPAAVAAFAADRFGATRVDATILLRP